MPQTTLKEPFDRAGAGLHSGAQVRVRVLPAAAKEGRYFVRVDLSGEPRIPAAVSSVAETTLSTELKREGAAVRTVEHLLAALVASGVDNARIEIDGPEVPLLDGSARDWTEAIARAGITPTMTEETDFWVLDAPIPLARAMRLLRRFPLQNCVLPTGLISSAIPRSRSSGRRGIPSVNPSPTRSRPPAPSVLLTKSSDCANSD